MYVETALSPALALKSARVGKIRNSVILKEFAVKRVKSPIFFINACFDTNLLL